MDFEERVKKTEFVSTMDNSVKLFEIDADNKTADQINTLLNKVVEENINRRSSCVDQVEQMITRKVTVFYDKVAKIYDIEVARI